MTSGNVAYMGAGEMHTKCWSENLRRTENVECLHVDGIITLKQTLR